MSDTLGDLALALDHDPFVLIVTEQRCFTRGKKRKPAAEATAEATDEAETSAHVTTRSVVSGIVSRIDLLDFISHHKSE